jgi:hypothetical protein
VTDGVRNLLRSTKDATVAFAARVFLNTKLQGIGTMTQLSIDTKKRQIHVRLDLAGEAEPIEIEVTKFEVTQRGGQSSITILEASTSRKWLTEVLRQFVVGKSFAIPPQASAVLKLLA